MSGGGIRYVVSVVMRISQEDLVRHEYRDENKSGGEIRYVVSVVMTICKVERSGTS